MTIVIAPVALEPTVSVATKLKLKLPVAVGVPVTAPVPEFRDRPVGRDPPITEYVFAPVPEPLETLPLYAALRVHAKGTESVLIETGKFMTMVTAPVALAPILSVATKLKLKLPMAVGVPVSAPEVGFNDKPVGRDPPLTEYDLAPVPPPLVTLPLYATVWVHARGTDPVLIVIALLMIMFTLLESAVAA